MKVGAKTPIAGIANLKPTKQLWVKIYENVLSSAATADGTITNAYGVGTHFELWRLNLRNP